MTPQPERPFGLILMTALNLGFGILNISTVVQLSFAFELRGNPTNPPGLEAGVAIGLLALPVWFLYFAIAASALKAVLLLVSGWGYFNFKRIAGRWVGNAYAVVSLVDSAVAIFGLPYPVTGGTIIGLLYPVFTLLAVNTMWKPLLVR